LNELYRAGAEDTWTVPVENRPDWQLVAKWLREKSSISDVLDVGCFDGAFLSLLPSRVRRFGVEIHEGAADRALRAGVEIVGGDYQELGRLEAKYECITAFDVVEHVPRPEAFVDLLSRRVRQDGVLIVSTGNSDARSWRMMKGAYWYCWLPEHVAFINPHWCRHLAPKLGLQVEEIRRFSHEDWNWKLAAGEMAKNFLYRTAPGMAATVHRRQLEQVGIARPTLAKAPPSWVSARDHFVVIFRKT